MSSKCLTRTGVFAGLFVRVAREQPNRRSFPITRANQRFRSNVKRTVCRSLIRWDSEEIVYRGKP